MSIDLPNDDIMHLIKKLNKLLAMDFDKRLAEYDLTGTQGRLLFYLSYKTNVEKEDVHQNDLEKNFGLSKSTVSGLVDRLEKKGLIERISEKPYVRLVPTDKGTCIVGHIHSNRTKTVEKLTQGLSEEDIKTMKCNIEKLIENLEKEEKNV